MIEIAEMAFEGLPRSSVKGTNWARTSFRYFFGSRRSGTFRQGEGGTQRGSQHAFSTLRRVFYLLRYAPSHHRCYVRQIPSFCQYG